MVAERKIRTARMVNTFFLKRILLAMFTIK